MSRRRVYLSRSSDPISSALHRRSSDLKPRRSLRNRSVAGCGKERQSAKGRLCRFIVRVRQYSHAAKCKSMQPSPISPYAVSKLAGELYMQSFARVYGFETVTIRYFNVFGPCQDPTSQYSGVLAIFTMKMLAGETPTIYGDGEQSRDFTFIQNVVHGNLLASEAPAERVSGKVFNVATGNRVTLNQTVEILRRATGYTGGSKVCRGARRRCEALARRYQPGKGKFWLRAARRLPRRHRAHSCLVQDNRQDSKYSQWSQQ